MTKFAKQYTKKQRLKVLQLFYRRKRKGEVKVDNTDATIAKEIGLGESTVSEIIRKHLDLKMDLIYLGKWDYESSNKFI